MIPWWVLKPACDLLEAVINRVSPIPGFREEAFRRSASFNALEVFEEEHEVFPGEQDGLDWMLSQAPYDSADRREAVGQYTVDEVFAQQARVWDERPDPMELFDRIRAEAKEMAKDTAVPPYVYRDSAAGAGADPSPAMSPQAGGTSPEGVIPPTPSGPPTVKRGLGEGLPFIQGYCPACGWRGLFVGSGGYITCSQIDCPDPGAVTDLLAKRPTNGTVAG